MRRRRRGRGQGGELLAMVREWLVGTRDAQAEPALGQGTNTALAAAEKAPVAAWAGAVPSLGSAVRLRGPKPLAPGATRCPVPVQHLRHGAD